MMMMVMPVYEVRPEGQGTTKSKVLHRNQLLPCDFLSPESKTQPMSSKQASERQRSQDKSDVQSKVETSGDEDAHYVESDEGETYGLTPEELSVTIPKAHTEAATLVNFHPATEEVFEAGHDKAGSVNNFHMHIPSGNQLMLRRLMCLNKGLSIYLSTYLSKLRMTR